ncbi:MAG: hypothetical protein ACI9KE_006030, partial [Polyangiales bacterium]
ERGHGGVWHVEQRGDPTKAQADLEGVFVDQQVSELILQDDGHLVGVLDPKVCGYVDALAACPKFDEEVVFSGQTLIDDATKDPRDHPTKRFDGDFPIRNKGFRFGVSHAPF